MRDTKLNIFFITLFAFYFYFFINLQNTFSGMTDKLWQSLNVKDFAVYTLISNLKTDFRDKENMFKSIQDLENKIKEKDLEIINLKDSYSKNEIKKDVSTNSKSVSQRDTHFLKAKGVREEHLNIYDTILLDKGFLSGLRGGEYVYTGEGKYLGVISKINEDTSLLALSGKSDSKVEASLASSSLIVEMRGVGGADFVFESPQDINISVGTLLYKRGETSDMIGEVVKVEKIENSFYNKVYVRGFYNPSLDQDFYIKVKTK